MFQVGVGVSNARDSPATLGDAACAKMLFASQNTAGGMFAESQELGCVLSQATTGVGRCYVRQPLLDAVLVPPHERCRI